MRQERRNEELGTIVSIRKKEMIPSPVANRSFLHGNRRASLATEKVVYATLDSLALKRTRLPLQLLPIEDDDNDDNDVIEKAEKLEKEKKVAYGKSSVRPSFKIKSSTSLPWKTYSKYLMLSSTKLEDTPAKDSDKTIVCTSELRDNVRNSTANSRNIYLDASNGETGAKKSLRNEDDKVHEEVSKINDDYEETVAPFIQQETSNSFDDYEKMDLGQYNKEEPKLKSESLDDADDYEKIQSKMIFAKSRSTNDLAVNPSIILDEIPKELDTRSFSSTEESVPVKKKKHFTKNVLHYVPGHFVRRPKKKKKKKKNLSSSLSSLKSLSVDPTVKIGSSKAGSRSKEELKYVTISSPTNFVHVASATNPKLLCNETAKRSSLEQVVITHEEKCATLPLLIGQDVNQLKTGNESEQSVESVTNKSNGSRTNYVEIKRESSSIPSVGKVLEEGQQVKIKSENQVDSSCKEKNYEPMGGEFASSPRALPRANYSFLWSNQIKNSSENKKNGVGTQLLANQTEEASTDIEYDDVGPFNAISQEPEYDDVGPPSFTKDKDILSNNSEDLEEIYDDVMALYDKEINSATQENNSLISDELDVVERRAPSKNWLNDTIETQSNHYLSISNEYSSVEEDDDEDQGLYDDVGLPCQERVNSLYAGSVPGSVPGSVLGLASSANGKESEWEDLEDPANTCPCRKNNTCGRNIDGANRKKSGQRWSRKMRRQRSRGSRKSSMSLTRTITDSTNFTASDSTSDDSTYETLCSFQQDDFGTDSDSPEVIAESSCKVNENDCNRVISTYMEAPTRPTPPPPREASLTQTLGRRIKMLRRTWSITKGSLGRIRRRTSVDDVHCYEDKESSAVDHQVTDSGKYFSFRKHFRKNLTGLSTFYLHDGSANVCASRNNNNRLEKEVIYSNSNLYNKTSLARNNSNSLSQQQVEAAVDHYSVLADQEPLYQFYAAAVARGAFESDSDGYEEVEDMMPSPAASELAKPGHRTLWCQTPQVIHGSLLQKLTMEERKIQEAKFEILTSEASYLNSLRVLENEFLANQSLTNEVLSPAEREKLFGGIPSVLSVSEKFLAELEIIWREDPMLQSLPEVLLKHAEKCLDAYVNYCSNQVSIDTTLKELRARKGMKFLETISQIETRPACQSLSLHSFLMLPMQRITRLPLLADAVLSKLSMDHQDRLSWERVLTNLSYVVAECNEGARAAAQEAEMEALAKKLEYSPKVKALKLKGKHLIRSGSLVQLSTKADSEYKLTFGKKFHKTPLYLFLLTDYLLVTKMKSTAHDEMYSVIDMCKRNLVALEPVSEDSPFAGRYAMILTLLENHAGRQIEYILTCDSNTERERWLEAVSPPKRGLVGETLYETWDCPQVMVLYSYSPNQPDELSLQPGDVINVLRKMVDGWYHGEKLLDGEQGWFPGNYTKEVASEHVRARNLKQRHRLLALSGSVLQRRAKQNLAIH